VQLLTRGDACLHQHTFLSPSLPQTLSSPLWLYSRQWRMVPGATKRDASSSPAEGRSHKRLATSSPEEGEVDDTAPLSEALVAPPSFLPPSLPPKPQTHTQAKRTTIAFPFKNKKKDEEPKLSVAKAFDEGRDGRGGYERPKETDHRGRGGDNRRRWANVDHWEPNQGEDSLLSRIGPRQEPSGADRRPGSPAERRSRSPGSPSSQTKHKLPSKMNPESSFSPIERDRGRHYNRGHDRRYDRRDDSWRPGDRDGYSDRHYGGRDRGRYEPDASYGSERHYRPNDYDSRRDDGRSWTRRDNDYRRHNDHRREEYRYERDDYDQRRRADTYVPRSPSPPRQQPPLGPTSPVYAPRSPSPPPPPTLPESKPPSKTPPPPALPPPPAPPPDTRLNGAALPPTHDEVSFSLKRPSAPPAPRDAHSPKPLPLPPAIAEANQEQTEKRAPKEDAKARPHRRREFRMRSKKEEHQVYGRIFEGCGSQSDYSVTTKLGEGTFG
jgi:serine/threonine-protein kinase BUR1